MDEAPPTADAGASAEAASGPSVESRLDMPSGAEFGFESAPESALGLATKSPSPLSES